MQSCCAHVEVEDGIACKVEIHTNKAYGHTDVCWTITATTSGLANWG